MPFLTLVRIRWFALVMGVLLLTASCVTTNSSHNTRQDNLKTSTPIIITPVVSEPDPLNSTHWELVAFVNQEKTLNIPEHPQPFIQFNGGFLGFEAGCNDINGYYVLEDRQITITFSESTAMDCTDSLGADAMEIEDAFFNAMQTFESYTIEGDRLHIYYADGELLFRRVIN